MDEPAPSGRAATGQGLSPAILRRIRRWRITPHKDAAGPTGNRTGSGLSEGMDAARDWTNPGIASAGRGHNGWAMKIKEIAFTGYSVTDMKRAKGFYEGVLGLVKSRGFGQIAGDDQWAEYDIGSGCLALITGAGADWPPSPHGTAAALEVDDFDGALAALRANQVPFVWEPKEFPGCRMVVVADPDGNRVVLHQRKSGRD